MKRQKSFKEDVQNNTQNIGSILNDDKEKGFEHKKPKEEINIEKNQTSTNATISTNVNVISRSNSGTELSAMEKHRLKMKDRRSVDKQKKLETGTLNNNESKDQKLNEDINKVLGYDEYFENQPATTQPEPELNPNTEINPIDAL